MNPRARSALLVGAMAACSAGETQSSPPEIIDASTPQDQHPESMSAAVLLEAGPPMVVDAGLVTATVTQAIAVGPFATCVIDSTSVVRCFGRCGPTASGGARNLAPSGVRARAVAVGRSFACAILTAAVGGSVVSCWGAAPPGAPHTVDVEEIAASEDHACLRRSDGGVVCWGNAAHAAPSDLVAKALAVSGAMSCAVTDSGTVRCWGPQVADPPADLHAKRIAVSSQLTDPVHGPRFGCVVGGADEVRCWGDDPGGVQMVPAGLKAREVGAARGFACAIDLSGKIVCWGSPPHFGNSPPEAVSATELSMTFRTAGAVLADRSFAFWGDLSDDRGSPPQGAHAP